MFWGIVKTAHFNLQYSLEEGATWNAAYTSSRYFGHWSSESSTCTCGLKNKKVPVLWSARKSIHWYAQKISKTASESVERLKRRDHQCPAWGKKGRRKGFSRTLRQTKHFNWCCNGLCRNWGEAHITVCSSNTKNKIVVQIPKCAGKAQHRRCHTGTVILSMQ